MHDFDLDLEPARTEPDWAFIDETGLNRTPGNWPTQEEL